MRGRKRRNERKARGEVCVSLSGSDYLRPFGKKVPQRFGHILPLPRAKRETQPLCPRRSPRSAQLSHACIPSLFQSPNSLQRVACMRAHGVNRDWLIRPQSYPSWQVGVFRASNGPPNKRRAMKRSNWKIDKRSHAFPPPPVPPLACVIDMWQLVDYVRCHHVTPSHRLLCCL